MCYKFATFALALLILPIDAQAERPYPYVVGATGRPYGPTQAHYQYQLRYGRPWNGGGQGHSSHHHDYHGHSHRGHHVYNNYYGYSYGIAPSVNIGPVWGLNSFGWDYPAIYAPPIYLTPPIGFSGYVPGVPSNAYQPSTAQPVPEEPGARFRGLNQPDFAPELPQASTPAAQRESVRFQAQGDEKLTELNYVVATDRYRQAMLAARDRVAPVYRLGVTLAARSKFLEAVDEFKQAVAINPHWPATAPSLLEMLGERNQLEKTLVMQRAADWLLQDSRDPNRLFLLGVLLHLDRDERAQVLFDTAMKVAGPEQHLVAFTNPDVLPANQQPIQQVGGQQPVDFGPQIQVEPEPTLAEPIAAPPEDNQGLPPLPAPIIPRDP